MRVLGLDLSWTATGVAKATSGALGGDPDVCTIRTAPGKFRGEHDRLEFIIKRIMGHVDDFQPHLVVVEGPLTHAANGLTQQGGIYYLVTHELWRARWSVAVIRPPTLKQFATGKGNANKADMRVAAAMRLAMPYIGEDECDALWLATAGLQHYGQPITSMPQANVIALEQCKRGHPVVAWPPISSSVETSV